MFSTLNFLLRGNCVPAKFVTASYLVFLCCCGNAQKQTDSLLYVVDTLSAEITSSACDSSYVTKKQNRQRKRSKTRKGVAALFAIALGPFGVHRMYLGTSEVVPLFYSLTLGGLMILPIVDLCCILFTKDIEVYKNNDKVIMW